MAENRMKLACMTRLFFLVFILACFSPRAEAQDIEEALRDFDRGRLDRVRSALDHLEARYYDQPEFLFLKAAFEEDAEQAFVLYQQINETAPDNPVFERVLWRMCQYSYAKGLYRTTNDMLSRFLTTFPESEQMEAARRMRSRITEKLGDEETAAVVQYEEPKTFYTIQIAAFGSRAGAERGLVYYKKLGITQAYIREHRVGRQILFKIWVGEYADRDEARKDAEELQRKYRLSAYTLIERTR